MENSYVPTQDHDYQRRRVSARRAESAQKPGAYSKCPCCRDDQMPNLHLKRQHSATTADLPQKRKRTAVARRFKPSAEHPGLLNLVPTPQPSTPPSDIPALLNLVPTPQSTIPPADLPVVSNVAPSLEPSAAPPQHDGSPLRIHNRSVEEYQRIYHEVVDDMLRFKNGRTRPYSLELGRRIKQKLWERLDRPMITESVNEDGLVHVEVSYGAGVYPPLYDVDISGEPEPAKKRAKTNN
ncbi:uncharacterized protein C22orf31-like [Micropterus dolomieu]|uniref:uncharacterized protein C22orf31-like n=1 Tax=Micropterus dolomieu TaxID=147949 RepID=UPI001E8D54F2|nr:uncharacterized protein C22orf31-like [Micropterus dolomieu]